MKKWSLASVATAAAVASLSIEVQAQELASQPGGASDGGIFGTGSSEGSNVFDQRAGDNVTVLMSGSLTDITWWGQMFYFEEFTPSGAANPFENVASFSLEIYEDDGGVVGALVGSASIAIADITTTADGVSGVDSSSMFRYEAELDTPIALTAGSHIVSIAAVVADPDDPHVFVWQWAAGLADDGVYLDIGSGLEFDPFSVGGEVGDLAVVLSSATAEPPVTAEFIEQMLGAMSDAVLTLNVSLFDAPNANAAAGRRKAISNKLQAAANLTAEDDYAGAIEELTSLLLKLDGYSNPPDWMYPGEERDELRADIEDMIAGLLTLL